jgi:aminocarboxymuconate-semialdehyde decarboxylase
LLMKGIFIRHPGLRIVLAHAGGTLPWLLPRLDRVWTIDPQIRAALPKKPSEMARSFYGDTITFDADNLALVAKRLGAGQLLVGSDYPFAIMEQTPGSVVDTVVAFDEPTRAALRYGNAHRLLGNHG